MTDNQKVALQATLGTLNSYNNNLDTRRGTAIRDLVVEPNAFLYSEINTAISNATQGLVELLTSDDPNYDRIDELLGNINITRKEGAKASGHIYVETDYNVPIQLKKGFSFSLGTLLYEVVSDFSCVPDPIGDVYYYLIPVTATKSGVIYNGYQDVNVVPTTSTLATSTSPKVYSDFTGGLDEESADSLLDRLSNGLTTTAPSYTSLTDIKGLSNVFKSIRSINAIGYGNEIVTRDRYDNPFGASGGCVDIYVKNFIDPITTIEPIGFVTNPDGVEIADVRNSIGEVFSGEEYTVTKLLAPQSQHKIRDEQECLGTIYEQITVHSDVATFMNVYLCPDLLAIQKYVDDVTTGAIGIDALVHSAKMLHVKLNITVTTSNGIDDSIGIAKLKDFINSLGIGDTLYASELTHIINETYPDIAGVVVKDLYANYGDNVVKLDDSSFSLIIPEDITNKVTKDTAVFVVEAKDIFINENYK